MNVHLPAPRRKWPGRLVNLAVVVVVLALAAATFVLSYTGVHTIAVQAGVSARFARLYPGLFDAVFVIACVAAVMLREARWWARLYAWLVIIVMVAVVGAADAVHAMNVALPHRATEGVVAATPWVLVLLGFSLMLAMLRHSRAQHAPALDLAGTPTLAEPPTVVDQLIPIAEAPPAADPVSAQEEALVPLSAATWEEPVLREPAPTEEEPAPGEPTPAEDEPGAGEPAPVPEIDQDAPPFATAPFAAVPRLNRVRATPIPPEDED